MNLITQRHILMTAWIILLVVLVGLLALVITQSYLTRELAPAEPMAEEQQEQIVEDEFANWQTYRNEEFGFEFKYPLYLGEINEKREGCLVVGGYVQEYEGRPCIHTSLSFSNINGSILGAQSQLFHIHVPGRGAYFGDFGPQSFSEVQNYCSENEIESCITQTNSNGILYTKSIEERFTEQSIILDEGGTVIYYRLYNDEYENGIIISNRYLYKTSFFETSEQIFDQIISTFKFIELDPTANWQTYRNEEFGFEVKYPEGWVIEEKEDNFGRFTLSLIDPETAHSPGYEFDVWILADPVGFAERGNYASLIDYLENSGVTNIISHDTIGAENESAILATTAGLGYTLGYHIEQSDNSVYEIAFSTNQQHYNRDLEIFEINATANQILSTFKFIE